MANAAVQINRDPVARASLMRRKTQSQNNYKGECLFCGRPGRFDYGWLQDGINTRTHWEGAYCSVSCYRSFQF